MLLPMRKLFAAGRILLLLALTATVLTLVERWRGGKRTAGASGIFNELDAELEAQVQADEALQVPGLGAGGQPVQLHGEDKRLGEEAMKKYDINTYLSDRIPYNRTLRDPRNPLCERVVYDAELPSASVIIIFHNEPYSVVLRTVWSVLNSLRRDLPCYRRANYVDKDGNTMTLGYPGQDPTSEHVYLQEVILVDDHSTLPELRDKLSYYVRTRMPPASVRVVRLPQRRGLMEARVSGARAARGQTLVFLDAHCEVAADWLRPLLQRVKERRSRAPAPVIDVIAQDTLGLDAADAFQVGGFTFNGHFDWIDIPERELKRRGSEIEPIMSPTMAGGLFAIDRSYFWELGGYDEQMAGWGGENLEMSFRVWQCGGTLECVPCSRVGHIFRAFHPYALPASSDTHGLNTARMAEVWMDEYAELFYLTRPDLRHNPAIGDIQHRKVLRDKLHCKSFQWYLDNVYPEKFVPVRDVVGYGRVRNPASGMCLDNMQNEGARAPLGCYPCHSTLQPTQFFSLTTAGALRDEQRCAEVPYGSPQPDGATSRAIELTACDKRLHSRQRWTYLAGGRILHSETQLCLTVPEVHGAARLSTCDAADTRQIWHIDFGQHQPVTPGILSVEQQQRLRVIQGAGGATQRRHSRSLLSVQHKEDYGSDRVSRGSEALSRGSEAISGRKRHSNKRRKKGKRKGVKKSKTKVKNKFILRLVRKRHNTTEHLELDVHCRHRTLLPNDSFVKDVVTALTDRDITVINNGRVFERARRPSPPPPPPPPSPPTAPSLPHKPPQLPPAVPRTDKYKSPRGWGALPAPHNKRIIVEDFIEVPRPARPPPPPRATGTKHVKPLKRLKHKRMRSTRAPSTPRVGRISKKQSETHDSEDTVWEGDERRDSALTEPDWQLDEPAEPATRRAYNYTRRTLVPRSESEPEPPVPPVPPGGSRRAPSSPVKLVLRSNLTFNLGDDFFSWRRQAPEDDVNEAINELSLPLNTTRARYEQDSAPERDVTAEPTLQVQELGEHSDYQPDEGNIKRETDLSRMKETEAPSEKETELSEREEIEVTNKKETELSGRKEIDVSSSESESVSLEFT